MGIIRRAYSKRPVQWAWFIFLILTPIVLWILPASYFDEGGMVTCPSRLLFDIECFGCGMTRAVMHFHHFQFTDALYFNYLVLLTYPALVIYWFICFIPAYKTVFNKA